MAIVPDIDLNLLRLLQALYEERSVTRAAERLFLTPSAVSHALRRLRLLFGDDLFVRGAGGMVPTARTHHVARRLQTLLPKLHDLVHAPRFDPAETDRIFTIACVPYLASVMMPNLAAGLAAGAPRVGLDIRLIHQTMVDDLESGALDVALGNFRKVPQRLRVEEVFRDPYVWVTGRAHAPGISHLDLETIGRLPHVELNLESAAPHPTEHYDARQGLERLVIQNDLSTVQNELAKAGLTRDVRFKAPDSIGAMALVASTNAIALIPSRAAARFADGFGLDIHASPFPIEPLVIQMLYHHDMSARPATAWLIEQLRQRVSSLAGDGGIRLPDTGSAIPAPHPDAQAPASDGRYIGVSARS